MGDQVRQASGASTGFKRLSAAAAVMAIVQTAPSMALANEAQMERPAKMPTEARLRCLSWRLHLARIIDLQERHAVITPALAIGLRAEIDAIELRCAFQKVEPLLDRFAAMDRFLYDETDEQLPLVMMEEFSN